MKKLLLLLLTTFSLSCCNNDNDKPQNPVDQLPPATQTGANTFGCLINGEPFVVSNTSNQSAIYQGNLLQISATFENSNSDQSIAFNLLNPLNINETYTFNNNAYKAGYSYISNNITCIYDFDKTYQGVINFTKIDTINFIVSGTFEFSTITENCQDIKITNGRFDLQYIP